MSLAIDHLGNLFVTDFGIHTSAVWQVRPNGESFRLIEWLGDRYPYGIAISPIDGSLFVAFPLAHEIVRITIEDSIVTSEVFATIEFPESLIFSPDGTLFVGQSDRVSIIDPDGGFPFWPAASPRFGALHYGARDFPAEEGR